MSDPHSPQPQHPSLPDHLRRVGWIGTGVMGLPMAMHLLDSGAALRIFSRTKSKAQPLLERGAEWCDTPAEAADGVDVACSMVSHPHDVEAVHLGGEGTLSARHPPRLLIDFTTSTPSLAERLARQAQQKQIGAIDAPVSGGDVGARSATLSIMVGGDAAHVEEVRPLLERLSSRIVRQGGPGAGQHTKVVNQILVASGMVGMCEGLLYAKRAGLDPTAVIESVGSGAAGSWAINNLGPRVIRGDFAPGFYIEHFIKDLSIALEEAARMHLALPGLALARQLYEAARAQGHARSGTQALFLTLAQLSSDLSGAESGGGDEWRSTSAE